MVRRIQVLVGPMLLVLLTACSTAYAPQISAPSTPTAATPVTTVAVVTPTPAASDTPKPTLTGRIVIDGSSTVFPITEAIARQFTQAAPAVQIQLGVSGTGGGFKKFCVGETTVSDASRSINQSEMATCAANKIDFIELPIAFDGISLIANRQNDWLDCITIGELKQLWEPAAEGKILRWNQIRATWPDQPISLHGAGTDSGTYDYFTGAVIGEAGKSRKDYTGSEDDYLIGQDVANQPYALGFFGYAYYRELLRSARSLRISWRKRRQRGRRL